MVLHTTFPDFVLFLYVHISHVDSAYDPAELKLIKEKMAGLFPTNTDMERKLYTAIREYNGFDKTRLKELIQDSFQHFHQVKSTQKHKVYTDIYDIVNADGKVDASERNALEALKQIIELGAEVPKA